MNNKTVLVTGASKGIGKAIALRLAQAGYDIWLNYRSDHGGAQQVASAIESLGRQCSLLCFDVADMAECKDVFNSVQQTTTPYAIVHNAGFAKDGIFAMMPVDSWRAVLDVHLNGFYNVTNCLLPAMLRKRQGRIITITSTSGQTGVGGQVNYSCAKAGLIGATRSLAVEVAKRNILVNAVAPGFIQTDMLDNLPQEEIAKQIPLQRIGKADEVAAVVAFLVSDDASYITGQVISVNGGIFTG